MIGAIRACPGATNARVLVADRDAPLRSIWCDLIDALPDYKVIGRCDLGQDAVLMASALQPDLVFADIRAHEGDGLAAVAGIVRKQPETRIVVHSGWAMWAHVLDALDAGANAFLYESDVPHSVAAALQSALAGRAFISPSLFPPEKTAAGPGRQG